MDLQLLWFILIAVLFIGYFFLEGFDFGVGMLMPFVSNDDLDRRLVLRTIGPHWDANEVWLITAGGAMFAAFPHWYATLFSTFYLPLFFILLALIVRAVGIEFREKVDPAWKPVADQFIFWGSLLPAFLWGVAFTNVAIGLPIGADMNYEGGFFNLLNWYAIVGGFAATALFVLHGAVFLSLRTAGDLHVRARTLARAMWLPTGFVLLVFALLGFSETTLFEGIGLIPGTWPILTMFVFVSGYVFVRLGRDGWAFAATALTIVLGTLVVFEGMFPNVMFSTLGEELHITAYEASSSDLTLQVMSIVALVFVPIVLAYQGWSYYVFRQRVTRESVGG